jgi:hypothetical protein
MYDNLGCSTGNLGCADCADDPNDEDEVFLYSEDGLGIVLPAIGGAISAISSIFGGGNPKDAGRLNTNAQHYAEAVAGNESALNFLKGMSGRFGTVTDSDLCVNGCKGWATSVAKDDAFKKYNQALSVLKTKPASTVTPAASGISFTGGPVIAGLSTGPLVIAGLAGLAIFALSRRR